VARRVLSLIVSAAGAAFAIGVLVHPSPASAADYSPRFAGWNTASGLFVDEASAEMTVPVIPAGTGLIDWIGIGGDGVVFQAGAGTLPDGTTGCWWEDYPYNDQVPIPGLGCAPGDLIFVDVAQAYYGTTQSRVIVEDLTTGEVAWLSVYTPDLAWNTQGELDVEANTSLGPPPSGFQPIGFSDATFMTGGYWGSGATPWTLSALNDLGLVSAENTLWQVIPGAWLGTNWPQNLVAVYP
jgi:hypothetical protein